MLVAVPIVALLLDLDDRRFKVHLLVISGALSMVGLYRLFRLYTSGIAQIEVAERAFGSARGPIKL